VRALPHTARKPVSCALSHTTAHTLPHPLLHTAACSRCGTLSHTVAHCRTLPHSTDTRTAIHYQAHYRTLPHCRTAAHCRARCHILPSALPCTNAPNAHTLPRALPHTTGRNATYSAQTTKHCRAHCRTLPRALSHTAVHCRTAGQPHTTTCIVPYTTKRTVVHCRRAHCHTLPLVLPHNPHVNSYQFTSSHINSCTLKYIRLQNSEPPFVKNKRGNVNYFIICYSIILYYTSYYII
jgi:hypothetical protein